MRKKFVGKKRRKKVSTMFFLLITIYFLVSCLNAFLINFKLSSNNEEFLKQLMFNSNHYVNYEKTSLFSKVFNSILRIDLTKPLSIIKKTFKIETDEITFMANTYTEDPNKEPIKTPRVYIYNSHQEEQYSKKDYANYGITPGVMMASYLLKEKLNKSGISTIALEANIVDFMITNNYTHNYSYVASRYFIEDVIKNNNFDLIIDLHRDSNKKKDSTVTINNENYAKILFVVGLENKNYQKNLNLVEKLENNFNKYFPGLSRGIYKKQGDGVDGVYNQDLNPNMILLEVGGYENTISEVNNTMEAVATIIKKHMESL
ncbi:MAG: stage II sporulation protein P [Bacilli bacterium]